MKASWRPGPGSRRTMRRRLAIGDTWPGVGGDHPRTGVGFAEHLHPLAEAVSAARGRGDTLQEELLADPEMLSTAAMAERLGISDEIYA